MAEDNAEEDGAAAATTAAEASADAGGAPAPAIGPPAPVAGAPAIATSRKADVITVGASVAGHLLVGVLIFGALASAHEPPQAIPVKLIPADKAPPVQHKPPPHPPVKKAEKAPSKPPAPPQLPKKVVPPHQQKSASQKPPTHKLAAAAAPAKAAQAGKSAPAQAQAPAKAAPADKKKIPWSQVLSSLGMSERGLKTNLSPALLAALRAQVMRCWSIPSGWSDSREVTVTLRFQLAPDGALEGAPAVVEFPATPIGAAAAKTAVKAVTQCGPYHLPVAQYAQWSDIQLTLAP